jgi:hypothetical protein
MPHFSKVFGGYQKHLCTFFSEGCQASLTKKLLLDENSANLAQETEPGDANKKLMHLRTDKMRKGKNTFTEPLS